MKVALCCVGKMENRYAREFVAYYKSLNIDRIFIYDNNDPDGEYFEEVLQDYIDEGFVVIKDGWRGKGPFIQMKVYHDCYVTHRGEYDWMCYFDFDEFLTLKLHTTIQEYLADEAFRDNVDCVCINWMIYGDNGYILDDGRGVLERFKTPCPLDIKKQYERIVENDHIKSIVNCNTTTPISWVGSANPHIPVIHNGVIVNNCGVRQGMTPFMKYNHQVAYIKHFVTKTIDEYINYKKKRGHLEQPDDRLLTLNAFFKINEKTQEKIDFIEKSGIKH
jgi:hypothetical protein